MIKVKATLISIGLLIFLVNLYGQTIENKDKVPAFDTQRTGKTPVIVIPGILGSELVNRKTKESVWVKFSNSKTDQLDLPISTNLNANRDDLVAADIVEKVKLVKFLPGVSVYKDLLNYLEKKANYKRGNWDAPMSGDFQDTYFVFAYDWRRDNVETAKLLIQKIAKLKLKLKKPDLKFDILAHSMGGLITRYAAMYGTSDLQAKPVPNWSGAKHINRIFMFGTPNEGSMTTIETLNLGYYVNSLTGRIYFDNLGKDITFTAPSVFQLLPHSTTSNFYDEDLNPLKLDVYDCKTWKTYGWSIYSDEKYLANLSKTKKAQIDRYFQSVLLRAKKFHEALDVKTTIPPTLSYFVYGSDCKKTLDGAILYQDFETKIWKTLTKGNSFKNSKGEKVEEKLVEQTIYGKGDGTVSIGSLMGDGIAKVNGQSMFAIGGILPKQEIVCDDHTSITANKLIQESFSSIIFSITKTLN